MQTVWANCLCLYVAIAPVLKALPGVRQGTGPHVRLLFSYFPATIPGLRTHTTCPLASLAFLVATKLLDTAVLGRVLSRSVFLLQP